MSANPPILTIPHQAPYPNEHIHRYLSSIRPEQASYVTEGHQRFLYEQENGFERVSSHWANGDESSLGKWSEEVMGRRPVAGPSKQAYTARRDVDGNRGDTEGEDAPQSGRRRRDGRPVVDSGMQLEDGGSASDTSSAKRRDERKLRRRDKAAIRRAPLANLPISHRPLRDTQVGSESSGSEVRYMPPAKRRKGAVDGTTLMLQFEAKNVAVERLTLKPGTTKGFLKKGASSAPVRPRRRQSIAEARPILDPDWRDSWRKNRRGGAPATMAEWHGRKQSGGPIKAGTMSSLPPPQHGPGEPLPFRTGPLLARLPPAGRTNSTAWSSARASTSVKSLRQPSPSYGYRESASRLASEVDIEATCPKPEPNPISNRSHPARASGSNEGYREEHEHPPSVQSDNVTQRYNRPSSACDPHFSPQHVEARAAPFERKTWKDVIPLNVPAPHASPIQFDPKRTLAGWLPKTKPSKISLPHMSIYNPPASRRRLVHPNLTIDPSYPDPLINTKPGSPVIVDAMEASTHRARPHIRLQPHTNPAPLEHMPAMSRKSETGSVDKQELLPFRPPLPSMRQKALPLRPKSIRPLVHREPFATLPYRQPLAPAFGQNLQTLSIPLRDQLFTPPRAQSPVHLDSWLPLDEASRCSLDAPQESRFLSPRNPFLARPERDYPDGHVTVNTLLHPSFATSHPRSVNALDTYVDYTIVMDEAQEYIPDGAMKVEVENQDDLNLRNFWKDRPAVL